MLVLGLCPCDFIEKGIDTMTSQRGDRIELDAVNSVTVVKMAEKR